MTEDKKQQQQQQQQHGDHKDVFYSTTQIPAYKIVEINKYGDIVSKVNSESVRLFTYLLFWAVMAIAAIVTAVSAEPGQLENSVSVLVFGYNSIWDTSPARHLIAMIHPFIEISLVFYIGLLWLRKPRAFQSNEISCVQMAFHNYLVDVFCFLWSKNNSSNNFVFPQSKYSMVA